jgi:hypothetical protein
VIGLAGTDREALQQRQVEDLIARAQEIIGSPGATPYDNHAALLYDEQGLPK